MRQNPRYVMVIGDEGTLLVPVDGRQADAIFAATRDDVARSQIHKELAERPKTRITMLVNSAAQEFRVEELPQLNILDRRKLIERRMQQNFGDAFAVASRALGAKQALLAGLHGGEVAGWCRNLPIDNITLGALPVEGAGLVKQLLPDAGEGWVMLLAQFKTGGLRQIVVHDGQLVFTRQTPKLLLDEKAKDVVASLQKVIDDTRGYLSRFGLTTETELRITLLAGKLQQVPLAKQKKIKNLTLLSPHEAAEKLGLGMAPDADNGDADLVFAGWIAAQRDLWLPLVPTTIKRQQFDARIARIGKRVAALILFMALAYNALDFSEWLVQLSANRADEQKVEQMHSELLARQAELAPSEKPLGRLRAAYERQRLFTEPHPQPWDVLRQLGEVQNGKAHLTSFDWHDDGSLRVELRLDGEDVKGAPRSIIVQGFQSLAEHLTRMMPSYSIEIARYPFPALPQEALSNSGNDATPVKDTPTASLMIRRRT